MKTVIWLMSRQAAQTELGKGNGVSAKSLIRNQREGR